jgi:hypothetical protein
MKEFVGLAAIAVATIAAVFGSVIAISWLIGV